MPQHNRRHVHRTPVFAVATFTALAMLAVPASAVPSTVRISAALTRPVSSPRVSAASNFYFPPDRNIQFASPTVGWLADPESSNDILGTTDGGKQWWMSYRGKAMGTYAIGDIESIDFVNTSDGWALLDDEGLISTRDGGHTWSAPRQTIQGSIVNYTFSGPDTGWVLTNSDALLTTANGGLTWTSVKSPAPGTSLCATPDGTLWLGESDTGNVYVWHHGIGWKLSLPGSRVPTVGNTPRMLPAPWITCSGDTAWLLYTWGESAGSMAYGVERTLNGGATWKLALSSQVSPGVRGNDPRFATVENFGATSDTSAWLIGYCGACDTGDASIIETSNGSAFASHDVSSSKYIHATPIGSTFVDASVGWAVLQENQVNAIGNLVTGKPTKTVVAETTSGGLTWNVVDANIKT